MATIPVSNVALEGFQVNRPPATFDPQHDLPQGFLEFLAPLHRRFAPWQQIADRRTQARSGGVASGRKADAPVSRRRSAARLANRIAGVVPGPAQPDDRSGRRRRAGGQDAQLGRARRDARPGRLHGQRVGAPANRGGKHPAGVARHADLLRQEAGQGGRHRAQADRDLDRGRAACTFTRAGFSARS